ncbi:multiple sugar transport system permease protein [Nocardia transvalensis]|uniref:Multiple sugar transport system permease protein n=1 Tax=Nocardia transvalensis TaxID=37333 RepID=A0A7W9ULN6_9NOCA|nr:sugar ABC transporter permease [Nocardia transvalensis]MBB5917734.1 multiple sugar transport system permease protein [Nocardia transvalensis]
MSTGGRVSALTRRRAAAGRAFIVPNLVGVLVFLLFPLAFSLYLSFHHWNMFDAPRYVGLENYRRLFTGDRLFYIALANTAVFTIATLAPTLVISLAVAAGLNAKVRGIGFFRSVLFLPLVASTAAITIVWGFMFNTEGGLFNTVLGWFGIGPVPWLVEPAWSLVSLCLVSIWKSVPFAAAVLLAAMQGVPEDLHEAARIDGAGGLRRFWSVTLPLIRPALGFVFVISIINSFQAFDQAYVLTGGGGGPETGTFLVGIMLFQNAFAFNDLGYACALAWVVFAILLALTYLQLRLGRDDTGEA